MKNLELNFDPEHPVRPGAPHMEGLGGDILLKNARWFIRIRWVVVAVLFAFGALVHWSPDSLAKLSLGPVTGWPWALAAGLAALNLVFAFLLCPTRGTVSRPLVVVYTWLQILADLVVLTILVHEVGSTDTFIVFAYLFHIVLACIFFAPRDSFLVTVLASVLFLGCWMLEESGVLTHQCLLLGPHVQPSFAISLMNAVSAVFIWFVVWYLTSTISKSVHERDRELAAANELLIAADLEKNLLMLRTVHDLKAPFSGIETNIEMLKMQDWESLPASARATINSIEVRAATLRERIKDILLLGELRKSVCHKDPDEPINLKGLLGDVIADLSDKAEQRRVSVGLSAGEVSVRSNRKQLGTLFANLIANAVIYSNEGGRVDVTATQTSSGVSVKVSDEGIGISEKALPHIFEEYFRAPEAAQVNQFSTGLGLAIVKHIAQNVARRVNVTSEQGRGTTFEVLLPNERT